MRWDNIRVRWSEFRPLAKRHWLALNDAQLELIGGRRDLLAEVLQQTYGVSGDAAELQIDAWCDTFEDAEDYTRTVQAPGGGAPPSETQRSTGLEMRRRTNPRD